MRKWKMLDMLVATQVKMSGSEKEKKSEKEHIRHLLHETCNLGPVHRQVSEYFGIHNILFADGGYRPHVSRESNIHIRNF